MQEVIGGFRHLNIRMDIIYIVGKVDITHRSNYHSGRPRPYALSGDWDDFRLHDRPALSTCRLLFIYTAPPEIAPNPHPLDVPRLLRESSGNKQSRL
jgi:hypothetical protein